YVWSGTVGPAQWQMRSGGDGVFSRIEPKAGQRWYQSTPGGAITVSTTGPAGTQGNASPSAAGYSSDTKSFLTPFEIDRYNCPGSVCDHMILGTTRVWETVSGGVPRSTWYIASPTLTKGTLGNRSFINQLAYAVSTNAVAIAGTNDGNVQYGFNMGTGSLGTWVDVTGGNAVLPNRPILDVATDPLTPTIGYAAVGGFAANTPTMPGHVYQVTCTANCGSFTWVDKSGNLPDVPVDSIVANPNYPQQVFAGTDWGLYFTNDVTQNPPTWQKFTAGLPNVMIWDMTIDRGFTTLALFTRSRGAYVWPLPSGPVCTGDVSSPVVAAPADTTITQSTCAP
ncbi:MAG TPA: hypothetical protein VGR00_03690, partial [Thermoanaerobaculia bacterium]|nr:hypothetical protein [Thermoanaerobaculia bacterium]